MVVVAALFFSIAYRLAVPQECEREDDLHPPVVCVPRPGLDQRACGHSCLLWNNDLYQKV
jgi:hypothetical protein